MIFDDGATDEQAYPHACTLGRVERVKESVYALRLETHARILYSQAHMILFVRFGSNHQLPGTIVDTAHRFQRIQHEVHNDLLQLDTIASDTRQALRKLGQQSDSASLQLTQRQRNHFPGCLIEI